MLNKMIDRANEFPIVRNVYAQNNKKVDEIFIEIYEGNICDDDEIYEDPWLK